MHALIVGLMALSLTEQDDSDLLTAMNTASVANIVTLRFGRVTFEYEVGSTQSVVDALNDRFTPGYTGNGLYAYTQREGRYECVFPPEVAAAERTKLQDGSWGTKLASFRAVTNGRLTLLDMIVASPDGKVNQHTAQIDGGMTEYYNSFNLVPFPLRLGVASKRPYGVLHEDLERALRGQEGWKPALIEPDARLDDRRVVHVLFKPASPLPRIEYWVDLERGAVPLQTILRSEAGEVLVVEKLDDLRLIQGKSWLPFRHATFMPPNLGKRLRIVEANFENVPSSATFTLDFPEPLVILNTLDKLRYEPRRSWNLNQLPTSPSSTATRFTVVAPAQAPVMPGPAVPENRWPFWFTVLGVLLLCLATAIVVRRLVSPGSATST